MIRRRIVVPSENVTPTSAVFFPVLTLMRSVSFSARSPRAPERARTKRMLSMMLLFPEPFGPDMTVNPSKKGIFVFLAKDLK